MRKILKIFYVFLGVIFILLITALIIIQTPLFKGWLKDKLVETAESQLNAKISVESVTGNLFTAFTIHNLTILQSSDSLLSAEEISVGFQPFGLLNKKISVDNFTISKPRINLIRYSNGQWNVARLTKSDSVEEKSADTTQTEWKVDIRPVRIISGQVKIKGPDTTSFRMPALYKNINLSSGFKYSADGIFVNLQDFNFDAKSPDYNMKTIRTDFELSDSNLTVSDAKIDVDSTLLTGNFKIKALNDPVYNLSLDADPLRFNDIRKLFTQLELYGDLTIGLAVKGPMDNLDVRLALKGSGGSLDLNGNLDLQNRPIAYNIRGSLKHFNIAAYTNNPALKSNINAQITINGRSTSWGEIYSDVRIISRPSSFGNFSLDSMKLTGRMRHDRLFINGNLYAGGASSELAGKYIFDKNVPEYDLKGKFRQVDLSKYNMDSIRTSDLNFDIDISGRGTRLSNLSGQYFLTMYPSGFGSVQIDTARIIAAYSESILDVKQLRIKTPFAGFTARGQLSEKNDSRIEFNLNIENANPITQIFIGDTVWSEGTVKGTLSGSPDSIEAEADMNFDRLGLRDFQFYNFDGLIKILLQNGIQNIEFEGYSEQTSLAGIEDMVSDFTVNYSDTLIEYDIAVQKEENTAIQTTGNLRTLKDELRLQLDELNINLSGQKWQLSKKESEIIYANDTINIPDFNLASANGMIKMSGVIYPAAESNFSVEVDSLNIKSFLQLIDENTELNGLLNMKTTLSGKLEKPVLRGDFNVDNLRYGDTPSRNLSGNLFYKNNNFKWDINLEELNNEPLLSFNGDIPVVFTLSPFRNKILDEDSLNFNLKSKNLQLAVLQPFIKGVEKLNGILDADIRLYNNLSDLKGNGPVKISNASLLIPGVGARYKDLEALIELDGKEVLIKNFSAKSGGGNLRITEGSISLSRQAVQDFSAELKLNKFKVMETKRLNADVDGDLKLSGSVNALELNGEITIPQARVYYPAWTGGDKAVEIESRPSFVIGPDSIELSPEGARRFQDKAVTATTPFSETQFYKNAMINLTINIPRNTWLRSEEANIEVSGSLDLIKEGDNFTIFGSLSTVRGYYELQGNRFQIEKGEILFKGNPEINPDIDVTAVHDFTELVEGERTERQITVLISSTAQTPQFDFQLDGQPAEQKDIVSVLLFGRTFNNLSIGQQSNVQSGSGLSGQATGFVTGQLINQLSGRLSSELNLDVMQIESGQSIEESKIRVGKYISPQVFVVVSQDFGDQGNQKIELEYEIPQKILFFNWFIQASKEREGDTAMDVILKIEW